MNTAEGVVQKLFSKKGSGKGGKEWVKYSFTFQNDDKTWYNMGFNANPKFREGDKIAFKYTEDPKWGNQVDVDDIRIVEKGNGVAPGGTSYTTGGVGDSLQRQKSIVFQSVLKCAVPFAVAAAEQGLVKLPTKKQDQLDAFEAYVLELAGRWTKVALNPDLPKDTQTSLDLIYDDEDLAEEE